MNIHIFRAVSSPSIANFVLRKIADSSSNQLVSQTIRGNFYVDDCLRATSCSEVAKCLIKDLTEECAVGGFRLTKFISNDLETMLSIPKEEHSKEMKNGILTMMICHWNMPLDFNGIGLFLHYQQQTTNKKRYLIYCFLSLRPSWVLGSCYPPRKDNFTGPLS